MAGISRDFEPQDGQLNVTESRMLGFPPSELSELETICGNVSTDRSSCTAKVYTKNLAREHPIDAPWQQPLYSNGAYQLLSYAFENITNSSFPQALQICLFNRLNMTDTYSSLPPPAAPGLIPFDVADSAWNQTFNEGGAEGDMYSSAADLVKLGQSIMNHALLTPIDTRRWLKPLSHTSSLRYSVGMPWEIYRRSPVPNHTLHSVDLFNKAGDIGPYHANFALVPTYNAGYTLIGGGNGSLLALDDAVVDKILLGLDSIAHAQAKRNIAGTYKNGAKSNITLAIEDNVPGVNVTGLFTNGTDLIETEASGKLVGVTLRLANETLV